MNQLTAIIPCKNERLNIRPCVEALRPIADEILIADSGSSDGTLDIVREIGGCRVIEREYINSGDFKNWAVPQATHRWVLIVDADERVTSPLVEEIRSTLEAPRADGYWIGRVNHFMGHRVRFGAWGGDRVLRLFRRDLGRYEGPSDHGEVIVSSGNVGRLRHKLVHYTCWSYDQFYAKFQRYTKLQAEQNHAAGRRAALAPMFWRAAFRFLRDYLLKLGFLDGRVGLQLAMTGAFYSFAKVARLWELQEALPQPDPEAEQQEIQRAA